MPSREPARKRIGFGGVVLLVVLLVVILVMAADSVFLVKHGRGSPPKVGR